MYLYTQLLCQLMYPLLVTHIEHNSITNTSRNEIHRVDESIKGASRWKRSRCNDRMVLLRLGLQKSPLSLCLTEVIYLKSLLYGDTCVHLLQKSFCNTPIVRRRQYISLQNMNLLESRVRGQSIMSILKESDDNLNGNTIAEMWPSEKRKTEKYLRARMT